MDNPLFMSDFYAVRHDTPAFDSKAYRDFYTGLGDLTIVADFDFGLRGFFERDLWNPLIIEVHEANKPSYKKTPLDRLAQSRRAKQMMVNKLIK